MNRTFIIFCYFYLAHKSGNPTRGLSINQSAIIAVVLTKFHVELTLSRVNGKSVSSEITRSHSSFVIKSEQIAQCRTLSSANTSFARILIGELVVGAERCKSRLS